MTSYSPTNFEDMKETHQVVSALHLTSVSIMDVYEQYILERVSLLSCYIRGPCIEYLLLLISQMTLIEVSVWKRGSGDKRIKTYITSVSQQIRLSRLEDKLYMVKEIS